MDQEQLKHFRRLWWSVFMGLAIGLVFSATLNVMHAPEAGGWIAKAIGGAPPVAVFLCIEWISRIPVRRRLAAGIRYVVAGIVMVMAAYVSFEHQLEYIHTLGFVGTTAYLLPLIIDGVMAVATVSLLEVTTAMRELRAKIISAAQTEAAPTAEPAPSVPAQPSKGQGPRRPGRKTGVPQPNQPARRRPPRTDLKPARVGEGSTTPDAGTEVKPPTVTVVQSPEPVMAGSDIQS